MATAPTTHEVLVDRIARVLADDPDWSSDTLDEVIRILNDAGITATCPSPFQCGGRVRLAAAAFCPGCTNRVRSLMAQVNEAEIRKEIAI